MADNTTWDNIKASLTEGLKQVFPIVGKDRELHLEDVEVKDTKDAGDYAAQKQAILNKTNWNVPVHGTLVLKDKEGKVLEKQKTRLLSIPKITNRNTIIYNGTEYSIANQLRLRPGVYTNVGEDNIARAQFNVGKGANFHIWQDPANGMFYMQFNQSSVPLYPILKDIGMSDGEIAARWGKEILDSNKQVSPVKYKNAVVKAFKKMTYSEDDVSYDDAKVGLKDVLSKATLDPLVTKSTLRKEHTNVTPDSLLDASRKVLKINRAEEQPDDRESLIYKAVHGSDDFIRESITKGARPVIGKVKSRLNSMFSEGIKQIFTPGALSSPIYSNINASPLVSVTQDANPLGLMEAANRITSFGPGGIVNTFAIPESVRNIHPSHLGFIDPVRTPESDKAGIDLQLSIGAKKDKNTLTVKLQNREGKDIRKLLTELEGKVVALPGQKGKSKIEAIKDGKLITVNRSGVDYTMLGPNRMFSNSTVLVPFLSNNAGARANLAGKMGVQALSLKYREKPLVQTASDRENKTNEDIIGEKITPHSPVDGEVISATEKAVEIKDKSGRKHLVNLYNNYIIGSKTFLHNEPVVAKGDKVKAGQLLADTNYTKDGVLAMGTNLKTIYVPYKGLTFEDGIVVSESAAQRLTSQHMYRFDLPVDALVSLNKDKWLAYFANKIDPSQTDKLESSGVIKPGTPVTKGDFLVAAMRLSEVSPEDAMLGKLSRKLASPYKDISIQWEKDNDGHVVDVVVNPKHITVTVRMDAPLVVGDKITNREGGKGVVTAVLPDSEMPKDKEGDAYEVILNPATVMSRMNIGQLLETAASKISTQSKPYVAPLFPDKDKNISKEVKTLLEKNKIKETDIVYDPSGKEVGEIFAGKQYFYKLGKTTETNYSARAFEGKYDADMMPSRGGEEGAKGIGLLDMYALLSHNARNILRESVTSKAESNPEFFKALQLGKPLPPPKPTFAFEKFVSYLKGAGVNVDRRGDRFKLLPLTDKDVASLSSGRIENALMLKSKDMSEEEGGLFDFNKTGGRLGNKWSHIELAEPIINPVFIEPARRLLGLKEKELLDMQVNSGGKAIKEMLSKIDVDQKLKELNSNVGEMQGTAKDDAIKQIKYLRVLKEVKMSPSDAYTIQKIPVIPPVFRPIYLVGDGTGRTRVSDANNLYKQVILVNEGLNNNVLEGLPEGEKASLRREMFGAVKALQGLDKSVSGKDLKGFITSIKGNTPKEGFFQSKLLKKQQDIAGRATIGGDPSLGLDEIKMPEDMAWTLYGPFVVRELVKLGMRVMDAQKEVEERTGKARDVLFAVMKERPVLLNRAPTLHKFNIMAFKPMPYKGKTLLIPPMVMKPYNADTDGDAMQVHVPVTEEARREALSKMLPSQNLFSVLDKSPHYAPSNEAVFGLYLGTKARSGSSLKTYQTEGEVASDLGAGKIQPTDPIVYKKVKTTAGTVRANAILPDELKDYNRTFTKKTLSDVLKTIGQKYPTEYTRIAKELKDLGDKWAFSPEASLSFRDFEVPEVRDKVFAEAGAALARFPGKKIKDVDVIDIYSKVQDRLIPQLMEEGKNRNNKFYEWAASGSRGSPVQFSSIWGAPVLVTDLQNKTIPSPIKRNFIEGLTPGEYFTSLYGTRKGITATKLSVTEPGAMAKEIVASNVDLVVTLHDCGTRNGIDMDITSRDALDRLLSADVAGVNRVIARRNEVVTSRLIDTLKNNGIPIIKVRSVLTCEAPKGVCASCAGIQESGKLSGIGENIGVKHSMSITEPLTQIALSTKHTAGIGPKGSGVARLKSMLEMPASEHIKEVLSLQDGVISNVNKLPTGGHKVTVTSGSAQDDYVVSSGLNVLKNEGRIAKGEPISDGLPNIRDYVAIKGIEAGRNKLTDTIKSFYRESGKDIDRRIPETIARGTLNYAKIISPGDFDLVPGNIVEYNQIASLKKKRIVPLNPIRAVGYKLADSYGKYSKGTRVNNDVARSLSRSKFKIINVYKEPVVVEPVAIGINKIPSIKGDWLGRMGFRNIENTIREGAATGAEANIHSLNPIPALSYGAEFGKGMGIDVY